MSFGIPLEQQTDILLHQIAYFLSSKLTVCLRHSAYLWIYRCKCCQPFCGCKALFRAAWVKTLRPSLCGSLTVPCSTQCWCFVVLSFLCTWQATREALNKRKADFGDAILKENDVGLIVDGEVRLCSVVWLQHSVGWKNNCSVGAVVD